MELDEAITVTKLYTQNENCYLMIGWQFNSFEMYFYLKDKIWKGRFSPNRLAGFSRNLNKSEVEYFASVKECLSHQKDNYSYELNSGFFYWKRKYNDSVAIEGFLPMELDTTPKNMQPDLVEILVALNKHLQEKVAKMKCKFETIKADYHKCLEDTEEFLNLKIEMEKALCDKFLNLIQEKKAKFDEFQQLDTDSTKGYDI